MKLIYQARGYEFWARWDAEAQVIEVFLSEQADDYILCATTPEEMQRLVREWVVEQESL